jgi:phage gpG-like protein
MTDPVKIEWDDREAQALFKELIRRGQDLSPLMADIGETLLESTQERFQTSTAPDGSIWPALRDGSGRQPLLDTGTMRDQIAPTTGRDFVELRATAKQARWHQEGTDPYVIFPKNGKALAFGADISIFGGARNRQAGKATVVKKVNHPGLPARAFMGVSAEDAVHIRALAAAYLAP